MEGGVVGPTGARAEEREVDFGQEAVQKLPGCLLQECFARLPLRDRVRCSAVCKLWCQARKPRRRPLEVG